MAFLGIFGKKSDAAGSPAVRKHAERVANKRAQAYDRWESIQALSQMRSQEAVAALLPRFTFYVEPSITDQEEKDAAFAGIVEAGALGLEPVVAFLKKADSISWPLKMLDKIVPPEVVLAQLFDLLAGMDVEYERDPESKIQILTTLAERKDPRVGDAVVRFLGDTNETVRFAAVGAIIGQEATAAHRTALVACLCADDSVRVRNRILEAFAAAAISVSPDQERVRARLTAGYTLDGAFVPRKKT
jgi:HEAT repeat protein